MIVLQTELFVGTVFVTTEKLEDGRYKTTVIGGQHNGWEIVYSYKTENILKLNHDIACGMVQIPKKTLDLLVENFTGELSLEQKKILNGLE